MAVYSHYESLSPPTSSWQNAMGSSYIANIFVIAITNSDGTLTQALGSFVLINGFIFSGTISELRRTSGGNTIEVITGLSLDALAFVSAAPDDKLPMAFAGTDTLNGNSRNEELNGGAQNDQLYGQGGRDDLHGDAGDDLMAGGPGDDRYFVTEVGDVVAEAPDEGEDRVSTALASYTLPANVESLAFQTSISHTGTGNDLANSLNGGSGTDTFYGLGGNDFFASSGGGDTFHGGPGDDSFQGGAGDVVVELAGEGTDLVRTFQPSYILPANVENLTVTSEAGTAFGNELDNKIVVASIAGRIVHGLGGNDTLTGAGGNDTLDGGGGDDTALFSQTLDKYALTDLGTKIVVAGPDGTDTLTNVEHLGFADGTIHVNDGSALFDTAFYMRSNLDVFHAGVNALAHFNAFGRHEGRDPNPFFDTSGYLAVNKDLAASGVNPLEHYHQIGWHEGRDPGINFDTRLYLVHNPDVAAAGVDPLDHYLQFGWSEGRQAYQAVGSIAGGFDAQYYLLHNPDVAAAGVDALAHFNSFGWHEGRNPNGWFDTAGYLAHYADVAAAGVNPLAHYRRSAGRKAAIPRRVRHARLSGGQSGCRGGRRQPARPLPTVRHLRRPAGGE